MYHPRILNLHVPNVQQQTGINDCGLFVMMQILSLISQKY